MSNAHNSLKYKPTDAKSRRLRRAHRTRCRMRETDTVRLTVHRTPRHTYAQIISGDGARVLVSASTLGKAVSDQPSGNLEAARRVGTLVAQRAIEQSISRVAFDRSGFRYHGRVKALADAARAAGLEF